MGNAVGQYTSVGFGKETTFGTAVTPTVFPAYETWSPSPKNTGIKRPGGRRRAGQSYMATGPYSFSASLRPEAEPDTLFPLLAYAFGAQSTPVPYVFYTGTTSASTTAGSNTVFAVAVNPITAGVTVGDSITVDTLTNAETCTVTARTSTSITVSATTKSHASGITITDASTTAYQSTLSFPQLQTNSSILLPSMTIAYNRVQDEVDYLGAVIDTLKLSLAPGKELQADFGFVAANEIINASPATPAFSTLFPLISDAAGSTAFYKGAVATAGGAILEQWDLSLNNALDKNLRTVGSRFVQAFTVGARETSGTLKMTFPSNSQYQDFLGATGATSPQASISGVAMSFAVSGQSLADATRSIPYSATFTLPNCFLNGNAVPGKTTGTIEQSITFDGAETPGQNNDLACTIITASPTAY